MATSESKLENWVGMDATSRPAADQSRKRAESETESGGSEETLSPQEQSCKFAGASTVLGAGRGGL
jgi:hypothetical protein